MKGAASLSQQCSFSRCVVWWSVVQSGQLRLCNTMVVCGTVWSAEVVQHYGGLWYSLVSWGCATLLTGLRYSLVSWGCATLYGGLWYSLVSWGCATLLTGLRYSLVSWGCATLYGGLWYSLVSWGCATLLTGLWYSLVSWGCAALLTGLWYSLVSWGCAALFTDISTSTFIIWQQPAARHAKEFCALLDLTLLKTRSCKWRFTYKHT